MSDPRGFLKRTATDSVARLKAAPERDPMYIRIAFAGAVLALLGFFLPWYSAAFAPPGGSMTVGAARVPAFDFRYNGLSVTGTAAGTSLRITVLVLFAMAAYQFAGLFRAGAGARQSITTAAQAAHLRLPGSSLIGNVRAVIHVLQSLAYLGLLALIVGAGKVVFAQRFAADLGGGAAGQQAAHYFSVDFGNGFWLMLVGILVSAATVARRVAWALAAVAALIAVLALAHHQWLGPLFHYLAY